MHRFIAEKCNNVERGMKKGTSFYLLLVIYQIGLESSQSTYQNTELKNLQNGP